MTEIDRAAATAAVTGLYEEVLGRVPDEDGLRNWVDLLCQEGAAGIGRIAGEFVRSQEFRATQRFSHVEDRRGITGRVRQAAGDTVMTGPFAGMRLLDQSNRGDGDVAPKLLGTYEQELHPILARFAGRHYDAIVDIGCAEGYYTVGLARLFPGARILAYDIDREALRILRETAEANDCLDRIELGDFCDPATLRAIYADHPRSLIFADCEGYERTLFGDPETNRAGAAADLIIECHDLWDAMVTPTIEAALAPTHQIDRVRAGGRDPNAFDCLADLDDLDRWRAVWERRQARMHWLVCEPRGR